MSDSGRQQLHEMDLHSLADLFKDPLKFDQNKPDFKHIHLGSPSGSGIPPKRPTSHLVFLIDHENPSYVMDVWTMERKEKGIHTWIKLMTFPYYEHLSILDVHLFSVKNLKVLIFDLFCDARSDGSDDESEDLENDYVLHDVYEDSRKKNSNYYTSIRETMLYVQSIVSPYWVETDS